MDFTKISYTIEDDIATIAFDDPATLNAAGMDTVEEMTLALEHGAEHARCTIITGNGRGFCSGANLSANPGETPKGKPDAGKALDSHYNPLIKMMKTHPHPIITAINGAAAGVGCSIALMGDFIIAGESGYFLQAFRRIPAQQALDWGLINRVVPDEALEREARVYAKKLADGPTQALALIRELIWQAEDNDFDSQLQAERFAQRTAGRQPDFREGVKAFLEKRPANFRNS